jgi:hypothetical protein
MKKKIMTWACASAGSVLAVVTMQSPDAPSISAMTSSASADQTLVISGEGLDGSMLHIQTDSRAFDLEPWMSASNRMLAVLPPNLEESVLAVWPVKDGLYGEPFYVNAAEVWWTYPSRVNAADGTAVSVKLVGRNLKLNGFSPMLHLSGNGVEQDLNVTAQNPYVLEAMLPSELSPGTYQLIAHNGSGGGIGWSAPIGSDG